MTSGIERQLLEGRYTERRRECEIARSVLNQPFLARASLEDLQKLSEQDILYRRAKHIVTDSARAQKAAIALEYGDAPMLGDLLYRGHISQRDDFDISIPQMDKMVNMAMSFGALGARQTGGGFGGCLLALSPKEETHRWIGDMTHAFPDCSHVATI